MVHGHDDAARESVARFVEKLGLKVLILHEQPNRGQTIVEKLELGAAAAHRDQLVPRARQNVIYELGFFCGALGRSRVCALYKKGVELPSDMAGIAYVPLDEGGAWKLLLAKELKAAGMDVDLNRAV